MKTQKLPTLEQAFTGTLFGSTPPQTGETIVEMDPTELTEITDQPFRTYDSDKLSELADSIQKNGQQEPCIIRKKDGKYLILAGRNRKRACERIGCKVKCIIRKCTDAEADLILTDTNLYQRHELLPSELAHAYSLQKSAYEARGERKSTAAIADAYGETVKSVQRYIKLAKLPKELLDMVDSGHLPVMAGVEISNMTDYDMDIIFLYLAYHSKLLISVEQAKKLRSLAPLTEEKLNQFFFPNKTKLSKPAKNGKAVASISMNDLDSLHCDYDFQSVSSKKIKEIILKSLKAYLGHNEKNIQTRGSRVGLDEEEK